MIYSGDTLEHYARELAQVNKRTSYTHFVTAMRKTDPRVSAKATRQLLFNFPSRKVCPSPLNGSVSQRFILLAPSPFSISISAPGLHGAFDEGGFQHVIISEFGLRLFQTRP